MENYFDSIPNDLKMVVLSYISPDDLENFITFSDCRNINWSIVFLYHFGFYRDIGEKQNHDEYLRFLRIEKLKNVLNLCSSVIQLDKMTILNLQDIDFCDLPDEMIALINLKELWLEYNYTWRKYSMSNTCKITNI